jgi:hypothetical protein
MRHSFLPIVNQLESRLLLADSQPKMMPMRPPPAVSAPVAPPIQSPLLEALGEEFEPGELPLVFTDRDKILAEERESFEKLLSKESDTTNHEDESSLREVPEDLPEDLPETMRSKKETMHQFVKEELIPEICTVED